MITALTAVAVIVGLLGIVIPVLPGLMLIAIAVPAWGLLSDDPAAWWLLAAAVLVVVATTGLKVLIPRRQLLAAEVPNSSVMIGGALGVAGFFLVPVVGLPLGLVAGVFLGEWVRLQQAGAAWASAKQALRAVGVSVLIETFGGLLLVSAWLAAVIAG